MERKFTNHRYLDALQQRVLVFDGATGTNIDAMELSVEDFGGEKYVGCNDYLAIVSPHIVERLHRSFLDVGVDVIETDTFRANRITMSEYGLQDTVPEINRQAAVLARRIADEYTLKTGQERFVAGSIGPSGQLPSMNDPEMSRFSFDELVDVFFEQSLALVQGGVDLLVIETSQDILELRAIILATQKAFEISQIVLPVQAQITLDTTGRMLLGTDIEAALAILDKMPVDVIGMNCSTGPTHMRQPIQYLGQNAAQFVSCVPNAGLPVNQNGKAVFPMQPEPFAEALAEFVEKFSINVVGGCCGSSPLHMRAVVEKVGGRPQSIRAAQSRPILASGIKAVSMIQQPPPFLIGERLNTQGSRKFKQIILDSDMEAVLELAREQVENGAHALDICVALTESGGEVEMMTRIIKTLSPVVEVPLVIDTTELDVLEAALKTAPGRCLINSVNLEGGRQKADRILALAKRYNAAVIALTIDEKGMAKTAEQKLDIASRIYQIAVQDHGLNPEDLVFDVLTFTLATGENEFCDSAMQTLQGIRLVKESLPGVLTSLGVSNVSFGLKPAARHILNSVFLYHAVQTGLDMAIVNPATVKPYAEIDPADRRLVEALIFNQHPEALQQVINRFEESTASTHTDAQVERQTLLAAMTPRQRLHWCILHRHKENVEQDIDAILQTTPSSQRHQTAVDLLNTTLLPAMKEVGDRFGNGELILPFVLQSAEVMKRCVSYLETYLEKKADISKGTIILATVYGDVHDIGKNLVKTILANNGYEVIDLGKQVPVDTIIQQAIEHQVSAIGLSALLVSTSQQMPMVVNELQRRQMHIPVLIGGAAINQQFSQRILHTEDGSPYQSGIFYCKDAFDGLATLESLNDPVRRQDLLATLFQEQPARTVPQITTKLSANNQPAQPIAPSEHIPQPPFWGAAKAVSIPLEEVFPLLDRKALFRLSWGAKDSRGEERQQLETELQERLETMWLSAGNANWLLPQAVYGYWPAQSDGNHLILYDPQSLGSTRLHELTRFVFPRQSGRQELCLADYFAPLASGIMDTLALQIVTMGSAATQRIDALQQAGDFSEAYFTHGLAVQTAEAAAEAMHRRIRAELNLPADQGLRYSWGYPAIPDISDHQKVFALLPAAQELGMSLTTASQMIPEQSTAAMIVHHPGARYFTVAPTLQSPEEIRGTV